MRSRMASSRSRATKMRMEMVVGHWPTVVGRPVFEQLPVPADQTPEAEGPTTEGQRPTTNDRLTSAFFLPCPAPAEWRTSGCVCDRRGIFVPQPGFLFRMPAHGRPGPPASPAYRRWGRLRL